MENEKYLPTGWHWKITPEQIEKIKQRDRDTVNKVYFDNLRQFKRMAYNYCRKNKLYSYYRDCYQQIYIDLPYFRFDTCRELAFSIKNSFARACMSCKKVILSLDKPLRDDDRVYEDLFESYDTPEKKYDDKEHERHVLEIIAAQKHLTERERDILTAYAFDCLVYKGLFAYEYAQIAVIS